MSVDTDYLDYMQNTVGVAHLFRCANASSPLTDPIGSLSETVTAGVSYQQPTPLVGNTDDYAITFAAAGINTSFTGSAASITGNVITIGCLFKYPSVTPWASAEKCLMAVGENTGSAHGISLIMISNGSAVTLKMNGAGGAFSKTFATVTSYINNAWHFLAVEYRTERPYFSIDGSAWATTDVSAASALSLTSGSKKVRLGLDYNASSPATLFLMDEPFIYNGLFSANAIDPADIYDKMLVSGFPQNRARNRFIRGVRRPRLIG